MQQLFPVEGETVPKLRFPEFRDAADWEEKELSQVVNYVNGKAHEQNIDETGKYIVVNSKFISTDGEVRKFTNSVNLLAKKNDVLMVGQLQNVLSLMLIIGIPLINVFAN